MSLIDRLSVWQKISQTKESTCSLPDFPAQLSHGAISEILDDVFFVVGQMTIVAGGKSMNVSRNMTILRDGDALTLINTLRLDEEGLTQIDNMGQVKHVVRLGAFHGRDDAFYLNRYDPDFWTLPKMEFSRGEASSKYLAPGQPGPCAGSSVFVFETIDQPEAILHLDRHGGLLISCDSLQNLSGPDEFFDATGTAMMEAGGFFRPANIGPGWRKATNPKASDFARLKKLRFRHLISGHGEPRLDDAHAAYSATLAEFYGV